MRNKLALTIALASFGVVTALGVGFAGADRRRRRRRPEATAPLSTLRRAGRSRPPARTGSTTTATG